jgi:hypothetical protein
MKISKTQNRIFLGLAIAALVAIFFYQVAYGMSETIHGPDGIWATIIAPNDSIVKNFMIIPTPH